MTRKRHGNDRIDLALKMVSKGEFQLTAEPGSDERLCFQIDDRGGKGTLICPGGSCQVEMRIITAAAKGFVKRFSRA